MNQAAAIVPVRDGICLPNGTRENNRKHVSRGGQAYSNEMREQVLTLYLTGGMNALDTPTFNQLLYVKNNPHLKTCQRWIHLYHSKGNFSPKETQATTTPNAKVMA